VSSIVNFAYSQNVTSRVRVTAKIENQHYFVLKIICLCNFVSVSFH